MSPSIFDRIRGERFSPEETDILIREVQSRQKTIYGDRDNPPRHAEVKRAWEEVAAAVNSARCGPVRSSIQCRKRFNDVKRLGKRKMKKREDRQTGSSLSASQTTTQEPDPAASDPPSENREGAGGPEGCKASQPAPAKENETESSERTEPAPPAVSPLRTRSGGTRQQDEQGVSDNQRSGLDMLHRELVVLRRSVGRMESRTIPLLRSISKSLERMADAFDYITAPATDGLSNSGLLNHTDI